MKDDTLPHLPVALDTACMQAVFQKSFFGEPRATAALRVRDCQIERVRYKPAKNCMVCYRLQIENSAGQLVDEQLVTVRLYEPGGSRRRFARAQNAPLARPAFGPPLLHLPDLDMVAWPFPNDRKLHGLPGLTDPANLRTVLLPPLIDHHMGSDWRIVAVTQNLVHYNPEHTAMLRVELRLENRETGEHKPHLLFGKTYYDEEGQETYRVMRQLWQRAAAPGTRSNFVHIPQPLAYQPEFKLLWQQGLRGQTLMALELGSKDFFKGLERAAAAVAALHQARVLDVRARPLSAWITRLREMRDWLPAVLPSCRAALEPLVDTLLAQAAQLGPQPAAILHGDLHLQNFFLDDQAVALIDLDNVRCGSPWQDVGSFIASLLARGLHLGASRPLIDEMVVAFVDSYRQHVPWHVTPQELNWFVAAALINERVYRCVTRLKHDRLDLVHDLVAQAAQISTQTVTEIG